MPFREKSAWISLLCLAATFGLFFLGLALGLVPSEGAQAQQIFFCCVLAFLALQIVLQLAARRIDADRHAPPDERERLISLKAARNAWAVLALGMLLLPASLHVGAHGPLMGYLAMAILAASEMVRAASRILYFRKGV
jgi:uncharacterized membrane protein